MLKDAGFTDIKIQVKENAAEFIKDWMPGSGAEEFVSSAYVTAFKPKGVVGVKDNVRNDAYMSGADAAMLTSVAPGGCDPAAAAAGC